MTNERGTDSEVEEQDNISPPTHRPPSDTVVNGPRGDGTTPERPVRDSHRFMTLTPRLKVLPSEPDSPPLSLTENVIDPTTNVSFGVRQTSVSFDPVFCLFRKMNVYPHPRPPPYVHETDHTPKGLQCRTVSTLHRKPNPLSPTDRRTTKTTTPKMRERLPMWNVRDPGRIKEISLLSTTIRRIPIKTESHITST